MLSNVLHSTGEDARPLPLIVAARWGFELQHFAGEDLYAVQDWIVGLTGETTRKAGEMWRQMKRQKRNSNTPLHIEKLAYFARDGKTYQRAYTNAHGVYWITQQLRSTADRQALAEIKNFLAAAGVFVDEARRNPQAAAVVLEEHADYKRLVAAGFTPEEARQWLIERQQGKTKRLSITGEWATRGVRQGRDYARLTNEVTVVATGRTATEQRKALQIRSGSLRDHLSALENTAIGMTEHIAAGLHAARDSQGVDELSEDVQDVRPIMSAARPELEQAFSKKRPPRT